MPLLDWSGKEQTIRTAQKSPYRLLIENKAYSYGTASQPASQLY